MEPSHLHSNFFVQDDTLQAMETMVPQPSNKTFDLQSVLPGKCAGAMVAQNLWLTNVKFNLWPMLPEEEYEWPGIRLNRPEI